MIVEIVKSVDIMNSKMDTSFRINQQVRSSQNSPKDTAKQVREVQNQKYKSSNIQLVRVSEPKIEKRNISQNQRKTRFQIAKAYQVLSRMNFRVHMQTHCGKTFNTKNKERILKTFKDKTRCPAKEEDSF